jgi:hypothetical protein
MLLDLKQRGLFQGPKLVVGDGALGFWAALDEVYPETRRQRCWVHKTANILFHQSCFGIIDAILTNLVTLPERQPGCSGSCEIWFCLFVLCSVKIIQVYDSSFIFLSACINSEIS